MKTLSLFLLSAIILTNHIVAMQLGGSGTGETNPAYQNWVKVEASKPKNIDEVILHATGLVETLLLQSEFQGTGTVGDEIAQFLPVTDNSYRKIISILSLQARMKLAVGWWVVSSFPAQQHGISLLKCGREMISVKAVQEAFSERMNLIQNGWQVVVQERADYFFGKVNKPELYHFFIKESFAGSQDDDLMNALKSKFGISYDEAFFTLHFSKEFERYSVCLKVKIDAWNTFNNAFMLKVNPVKG